MRKIFIVALIVLASCSPRAELVQGSAPGARTVPVFVGTTRRMQAEGQIVDAVPGRSERLTLGRYDIAVPPQHRSGTLVVPTPKKTPDPSREFMVADARIYPAPAAFRAGLAQELSRGNGEAVVFVHGYNNNFAEGLYRFAQMGVDFGLPGTMVHYSWPSRGQVMGYGYDIDSALFARDGLADLLKDVRRAGAKRILLVGHSMGGLITMEALRQLAITHDRATLNLIRGVILISPDVDVDLFRAEAHDIGRLPQPFLIFTSQTDKALGLSAQIRGEAVRIGNLSDISQVADLKVTMIDTAKFDTEGGHFNVATSPALIQLLRNSKGLASALQGEQARRHDPFASVILGVQNATQIVLSPVEKIGAALDGN